jgi:hypothetical protein
VNNVLEFNFKNGTHRKTAQPVDMDPGPLGPYKRGGGYDPVCVGTWALIWTISIALWFGIAYFTAGVV